MYYCYYVICRLRGQALEENAYAKKLMVDLL